VASADEALGLFQSEHFDCLVLDLKSMGVSGLELEAKMRTIPALKDTPVIVYASTALSESEAEWLEQRSHAVIIKTADSLERLLDETSLLLHRVTANLPEPKRKILEQLHKGGELNGRKILVVDDDVRNLYALTGLLEGYGMEVLCAENGEDAIASLQEMPVDAVLMDVMMPVMDGYETTRRIRVLPQFASLPVIALTAKAMKGDREKCVAAGASDYLTKPVDDEQLLSLLRVWVQRK
jgi:CheY-like chemotaxis protein